MSSIPTAAPRSPAEERSSVAIARSFAEVDGWPAPWRALRASARLGAEEERAAARWTPGFERPHTILVHAGDEPRLAVAAQIQDTTLALKVGYRLLGNLERRAIEVRPDAIAGDLDDRTAGSLVESLVESLRAGEAEIAILHQLSPRSPLHRAIRKARPWWCRNGAPSANVRWILPFPERRDAALPLSTHTRRLSRYYTNRLRRRYGERLKIDLWTRPEDLDRVVRDVESVAATTYQRRLGVGFFDGDPTRRRLRYLMEHGRYRAFVLSIDDRPCAFWLGVRTGARYESQETGFDPSFAKDHVGKVLLAWKLEALRREGGIREFDFGFGDAAYKSHHATERIDEETVVLFAPTLRGAVTNLAHTGVGATNRSLRSIVTRLSVFEAVRSRARRRLVERDRTEES